MKVVNYILALSRKQKIIVSFFCDSALITAAYFLAFSVRLDNIDSIYSSELWLWLLPLIFGTIIVFYVLGLYKAILRYLTLNVFITISIGAFVSMIIFYCLRNRFNHVVPITVPVIYSAFLYLFICGVRVIMRTYISSRKFARSKKKNIIIYGAGSTGRQLCFTLRQSKEYTLVAFIDRDINIINTNIMGLKVFDSSQLQRIVKKYHVSKVFLAFPRASRAERKAVLQQLEQLPVEVKTVPDLEDILSGKAKVNELREVKIEDLLGRDPVTPNPELLSSDIKNKVVMVTGAGGSIGSELCRQIIRQKPNKLILFEISELNLYLIEKELLDLATYENLNVRIYPLLGNVQRKERLKATLDAFKVQTLYHAAAYKHVPMVEYNVIEGVQNNVFGTLNAAQTAITCGVETFVLISTDKAVRPTNVMGATKRMAELVLQALSRKTSTTRFSMVRFGNVLGSSGSVIPLFKHQIKCGGPVTVTDKNIIRYFMTIPEAAQLVIQAGAMAKGGDVFVLDMGEPVKISELARKLIKLSGLEVKDDDNPSGDIEIKYTGLRPGEKLFEELLIGQNVRSTQHQRIMTADEVYLSWDDLENILFRLETACKASSHETVINILLESPTDYSPTDEMSDLVWKRRVTKPQSTLIHA